ncbi:MAG TPA: cupin domain-containing protein [Polyangiaceae bacterium]|nr:cupin domain-containing protein [Polyangiaceae bacterium]
MHHYHSVAHEVLGVYRGSVDVMLGGEHGTVFALAAGDVVVIPAGLAHKNVGASSDFAVAGAYPAGTSPDMNFGRPGERPAKGPAIAAVTLPSADPVQGTDGALVALWSKIHR